MSAALDPTAAATLVAAAAGATPADAPDWASQVRARAFELLRLVPDVVERSGVLAACRPVTGILASVEESKGRGVLTIHATMGTAKRGQETVDGRPVEYVRTAWLSEPAGRALFDQARGLVGRHCRFGKWTEQVSAELKVSMVEWIEDLGAQPGSAFSSVSDSTVPDRRETDDDPFRPFDESNELLAGPGWARKFEVNMTVSGWNKKIMAAVVGYATNGRTRDARGVRRDETAKVADTHRRLDAGELAESEDGSLVDVRPASGSGAAA